jgi:Ca2+-binding RTX toxin-like protein
MLNATDKFRYGKELPRDAVVMAAPVPDAARQQRRRRERSDPLGVATPLSATFLGLLLVQGFATAEAGTPGATGHRDGSAGEGQTGGVDASGAAPAAAHGFGQAGAGVAADGMVSAGDLFDPTALIQVSGDARFAEGVPPAVEAGLAGGIGAPVDSMPIRAAPAPVTLSLGGAAVTGGGADGGGTIDPDAGNGAIGHVDGGSNGDDTLIGTPGDDSLSGGNGDDVILGQDGDDSLDGGVGNDSIYGGNGNDHAYGNSGDDLVDGGNGNDTLDGGTGHDSLYGGNGLDTLSGGEGNDTLDGGLGHDTMVGGGGKDILVVDDIHDLTFENHDGADGGGIDMIDITQGYSDSLRHELPDLSPDGTATFVLGSAVGVTLPVGVNDYVQQVQPDIESIRLSGDIGHDVLGDGRDNRIIGNDGDNRLFGGAGDDTIQAGDGHDYLYGGEGHDLLYGEGGDDVFVLGLHDSAVDTVFDHAGVNTLRLAGADPAKLGASLLDGDLHLGYDGKEIAVVQGYTGHEASFAGIDLGGGTRSLGDFIGKGVFTTADGDILGDYLPRPDLEGGEGHDILQGSAAGDWLAGRGGNDTLYGGLGDDTLEGNAGNDRLEGGAGNDTYLFARSDGGVDHVADLSGHNLAVVDGAEAGKLGAFLSGQDLWVVNEGQPIFVVEGFAAHRDSFAGVKAGERVVDPNELMS